MSKRLDLSWVVMDSIENAQHDRCVDVFVRPDGSFGFEEFRRDPEDAGSWTPMRYYSGAAYPSKDAALIAATNAVTWLKERRPPRHSSEGSRAATTASASELSTAVSKAAPGETNPPDTRPSRRRS